MAKAKHADIRPVAQNRKARHNYHIEESLEAGIVLTGSEVKSLRQGRASIGESFASAEDGEIWLVNAYIPEYGSAKHFTHETRRARKLLMKRKEMARYIRAAEEQGTTLVPLSVYFNARGIAKVNLAIGRGKKAHDKRETDKKRDWDRQRARLLRHDA